MESKNVILMALDKSDQSEDAFKCEYPVTRFFFFFLKKGSGWIQEGCQPIIAALKFPTAVHQPQKGDDNLLLLPANLQEGNVFSNVRLPVCLFAEVGSGLCDH